LGLDQEVDVALLTEAQHFAQGNVRAVGFTGTMLSFIETNDATIQRTAFLAVSSGATTEQLLGIEAAPLCGDVNKDLNER
jgi:hypothetical protein